MSVGRGFGGGAAKWVVATAVLIANSLYLAATADASLFYFANVTLHIVLGAVLPLQQVDGSLATATL